MSSAERVGPFVLKERIAVGGMAEIFRAQRAEHPSAPDVVIKRLLPQYARDAEVVEMLAHEGRLMQRVAHPALVRVLEVAADARPPYLVLEHIDGVPLSELLDGPVSPEMALAAVRPVLEALGHVHAACDEAGEPLEVVHRDVTPENVLVDRTGVVRLGDFGIARSSLRDARTRTGMIKGKLRYLAPEQVTGSSVDRRTDLYAVGLMLFELVAGEPFLSADSEPQLIRLAEAPTLRSCGHAPFDAVLRRALARFPEARPRDAAGLLRALEAAVPERTGAARGQWAERAGAQLSERPDRPEAPAPAEADANGKGGARSGLWVGLAGLALAAGASIYVLSSAGSPDATVPAAGAPPVTASTPDTQTVTGPSSAESSSAESSSAESSSAGPDSAGPDFAGPDSAESSAVAPAPEAVSPSLRPDSAAPAPSSLPSRPARLAPPLSERPTRARPAEPAPSAPESASPGARPEAEARAVVLAGLEAGLQRRGIRVQDLSADLRAALAQARQSGSTADLGSLGDRLSAVEVDEPFVRRKLQRVDGRIRAARASGQDVTAIEGRSALALQSLLAHRPVETNAHLNWILDRLR